MFSCSEHKETKEIQGKSKEVKSIPVFQFGSMYPGGNKLFVAKDGDIYQTIKQNDGNWSALIKVEGDVNTAFEESNPAVSPNGKFLYYTSDRKGSIGGKDIFMAKFYSDGSLSDVLNLGPTINSKLDEDMPYVSEDGKRFYYSSKAHKSIGGYDVFMSEIKESGFAFSDAMTDINTQSDDLLYLYFLSEGYAIKTDSIAGINNLIVVNPGFKTLITDKIEVAKRLYVNKDAIAAYLNGTVDYNQLLESFGEVKIKKVHFELQIGASKNDIGVSNQVKKLGKIVVRNASNGYKRYSLGNFETLNETEKIKAILEKEGYKDAFLVCYAEGEKVTLAQVLEQYLNNEVGN